MPAEIVDMESDNWEILDAIDVLLEFLGPERGKVLVGLDRETLAELVSGGRSDAH